MILRFARVLTLICLCISGAGASPVQSPIEIDEDIRVFTMVTALNVSGFDVELGSQYHPMRAELRKIASALDPDLLQRMRAYYSAHKGGYSEEDQLAKYISLAVVLSDPPFKPVAKEEALPDDARSVLDFVPLLQEFYQKATIARIWAKVAPAYEAEMNRIGPSIRDAITKTDAYLRVIRGGILPQTMKVVVELGAPQNTVNVRNYHDDYSVVLGFASTPKVEEIRHAYIHLRLNNYAGAAALKIQGRGSLTALLNGVPGVQREYAASFENMFTESLVRVVELRLDRVPATAAAESVRDYYRSGLLLAPYFYESMPTYEAGDALLRDEIARLASGINIAAEQDRFLKIFNTIPVNQRPVVRGEVPAAPVATADPVFDLLKTAEAAFERDKPRAREAFEKVLKDHDPNNGRALYGIGLIEMDKANLDEALVYFERTLASGTAPQSMKTWAHIYSGHILDFKCNRSAAVEHYRKAVESGDDTRDAQKVARRDLAQPFGGECQQ